jgi:hypothetical protein
VLEAALGLPVVPVVASRIQGLHELVDVVQRMAGGTAAFAPHRPEIQRLVAGRVPAPYPATRVASCTLRATEDPLR